jgi:hypothetical protein
VQQAAIICHCATVVELATETDDMPVDFMKGCSNGLHQLMLIPALCCAVQVIERLQYFAPLATREDELPGVPIHQQALELAEAAASPKTLCRMDPTWHPWF